MSLNCFQVPADKSCNPQPLNIPGQEQEQEEEIIGEYVVPVAEGTHLIDEQDDDDDQDATLESEQSQNKGETIICSNQTLN